VVACVGGGSNAAGMFYPFVEHKEVELVGVEAGGRGGKAGDHAAPLSFGSPGVLHGSFSYVMQDEDGQTSDVHSVSAGLDYPGVGPEHSFWRDTGRVKYTYCQDDEALKAFDLMARNEGILPALESSHAWRREWRSRRSARRMKSSWCAFRSRRQRRLRSRPAEGDESGITYCRTMHAARPRRLSMDAEFLTPYPEPRTLNEFPHVRSRRFFRRLRSERRKALMPFVTAGDPDLEFTAAVLKELAARGAHMCELGIPYSDPIADGPVIQASYTRALDKKVKLAQILETAGRVVPTLGAPVVTMVSYAIIHRHGAGEVRRRCEAGRYRRAIVPDLLVEESAEFAALCVKRISA